MVRGGETQTHISEAPAGGIIVYYPWLVLTGRPAVSHSRRLLGVLTVQRVDVRHHTPGGQQLGVCVCVLYTDQLQGRLNYGNHIQQTIGLL